MFISDVAGSNKEELHNVVICDLRHIGVKHRIKKSANKQHSQHIKHGNSETTKVFRVPLHHLDNEAVFLNCGTAVEVPCFVARACSYIKQHIGTEGVFRKAGSTSRQKGLKASLDCGKKFGPEHHVIDVANILKMFFRELPEPLIPHAYHDVLLRCMLLQDKKIEGILLTCLLIPTAHINTLAYLMQFLLEVASHSDTNKMDVKNLAIIIAPSIMPVEERIVVSGTSRLSHHVQVVELLIHNADKIGNLPENVYEKLVAVNASAPSLSNDEQDSDLSRQSKKKKKRRSGSITRVLNGLKKIVGKGTPEVDENHLITSTPDFSTPCVKSGKKRKASEGSSAFSSKKKRDVLEMLPQSVALANIPYTPSRSMAHDFYISSPVCSHPNPSGKSKSPQSAKHRHRRFFTSKLHTESGISKINGKETRSSCKKTQRGVGSWSGKKQKPEELAVMCNPFGSDTSCHLHHVSQGSSLEQSWSEGPWGRKKHLNLSDIPVFSPSIGAGVDITSDGELVQVENPCNTFIQDAQTNLSDVVHVQEPDHTEEEFVRIPKSEYEAIKSRVSAIENRISQEFGNIISTTDTDSSVPPPSTVPSSTEVNSNAESVQTAYEITLVESEKLGESSADHLARRLNRELRIRRSLESKVMRSPSARKIGTIRRRSKENARSVFRTSSENKEIGRNMSWHLAVQPNLSQVGHSCPRSNLKRGRPNTICTGLPQPSPRNTVNMENKRMTLKYLPDISSEDKNKETLQNYQSSLLDDDMMNVTDVAWHLDLCRASDRSITRNRARRASSFHCSEWALRNQGFGTDSLKGVVKSSSHHDIAETAIHNSLSLDSNADIDGAEQRKENEDWKTADVFFSIGQNTEEEVPVTGRASVAKLRTQNAGMVLERMKLFDPKANCSLHDNEKEKSVTDSKTTRAVHVPSVFACHTDVSQSLRIQCSRSTPTKKHSICSSSHSKSAPKIQSLLVPKYRVDDMLNTLKDSPKKIGAPRRKHRMKSPNSSHQKQKFKVMKSPSRVDPTSVDSPASTVHRKHSSMKVARDRVYTNTKANLTAPINWLSTEKENVLSPDHTYLQADLSSQCGKDLKEEPQFQYSSQAAVCDTFKEMCSPTVCKISMSPLKDCNRIEVSSQIPHLCSKDPSVMACSGYRTPRETPYIKQALFTKSPMQFCKTPQSSLLSADRSGHRYPTPMKAVAVFGSGTPVGSPRRQSPRLLALKSRNIP